MRLIGRLSTVQRVVVVIALGIALVVLGRYLVGIGAVHPRTGWSMDVLSTQPYRPRTGLPGWLRLIIWLALTGLWAVASLVLLRPSREPSSPPG
jgi:hypothetical protein